MIALLLACAEDPGPGPGPEEEAEPVLDLLTWDGEQFTYDEGFEPYTLATPLFSDHASKERAIRLPEGTVAGYTDDGVLDFPVGTVIVKSFLFPADLRDPSADRRVVETRVLTLEEDGWDSWPYLWNEEQTEATRAASGAVLDLSVVGLEGEEVDFAYLVPQRNQCVDCHEATVGDDRENLPIGPTARNLNHGDQLQQWVDRGLLDRAPDDAPAATDARTLVGVDPTTLPDEVLFPAARDYLDVNCAHCHNPNGAGRTSGLVLWAGEQNPAVSGVCKSPVAAGQGSGDLSFDITPGHADQSIMIHRMRSNDPAVMMPELGRAVVHDEGVALVESWIDQLPGSCALP